MRDNVLRCHCCGEQFNHHPAMTISLIGFIWNPEIFDCPGNLYDMCPECKKLFILMYLGLQAKRRDEIEAQKNATWKERLEATTSCRQQFATSFDSGKFAPSWNYSQNELKHPAGVHRQREEQKVWKF